MTPPESWPLVLSAEATIPGQTTQAPPQLPLMNPTGEAFKIHEIRFSLKSSQTYLTGGTMACKLDLGKIAITNGFVPIWNFGKVISYDQDLSCQYSWRLAQPLQVPAGAFLAANFQNLGQSSTPITTRITYFTSLVGEESAKPKRIFLPYITAYTGKAFAYESADTDTSRETDLANPFETDLRISRLIGRFNLLFPSTPANSSIRAGRLLSARVTLSNGDPLVRLSTPFEQIFGQEGRAWEQKNTVLKPNQYFQVFMEKSAAPDVVSGLTIQPFVSLVGYRELRVTEGY